MSKTPTPKFTENVKKLSSTQDVEMLYREWVFVKFIPNDKKDKRCLCHAPLKNQYYYNNLITNKMVVVGKDCRMIFKHPDSRTERQPNLIRYIRDCGGVIGDEAIEKIEFDLNEYCIENYERIIGFFGRQIEKLTTMEALIDYENYLIEMWYRKFDLKPLQDKIDELKNSIQQEEADKIKEKERKDLRWAKFQNRCKFYSVLTELNEYNERCKRWRKRARKKLKTFIKIHMEVYNSDAYLDYYSK